MMALAWFITGGLFGTTITVGVLVWLEDQRFANNREA